MTVLEICAYQAQIIFHGHICLEASLENVIVWSFLDCFTVYSLVTRLIGRIVRNYMQLSEIVREMSVVKDSNVNVS